MAHFSLKKILDFQCNNITITYPTIQGERHCMFTPRVNSHLFHNILTQRSDLTWHRYVITMSETQTTIGSFSTCIQLNRGQTRHDSNYRLVLKIMVLIMFTATVC